MRNMLLTSAAVPALLCSIPAQAQECTAAPDCSRLGYTKTAAQCSGKTYTRCPFDDTKYNCDNAPTVTECNNWGYWDDKDTCPGNFVTCPGNDSYVRCLKTATVGDIKYSLKTKNHDGWLLCNGASYKAAEYPELYAAIGQTFGNKLPNYVGYFFKGAAELTQKKLTVAEAAGLPNITGEVRFLGPNYASSTATDSFTIIDSGKKWGDGSGSNTASAGFTFDASKSSPIYGKSTTVTPPNYPVNVFIYAGRKMSGQSSCEKQGYLSAIPTGQTCTYVTGGCYKNCKPKSAWDICVERHTVAYGPNGPNGDAYPPEYCYGAEYDDCGTNQSIIDDEGPFFIDGGTDGCELFMGSLMSECELDSQCMSSQYGV